MSDPSEPRESRREALRQQLEQDLRPYLDQITDELVDLPEAEEFGDVEYRIRDIVQRIAAQARQTAADTRKKRATKAPPASAPDVEAMPDSSDTATKAS